MGKDNFWNNVPIHYPPSTIRPSRTGTPVKYPPVQATAFPTQQQGAQPELSKRRQAVRDAFAKCWQSYKKYAWGSDELTPVSGGRRDIFGGWAATLVDSLDTLWIMDLKAEFYKAVAAAESINFTHTELPEVNIFETNIRYLGGFLSAFDLSGDIRLLRKAVEVGEMLYKAFDTPNRMPVTRWDLHAAARGEKQVARDSVVLAEIGSLSMEFTRLSMLTGDSRWFDAVQHIADEMAAQQGSTALPGLWPLKVNGEKADFSSGSIFSLGSMADSAYEYLPKMAALIGGELPMYQEMYEKAMDAAIKHNLFRPLTPTNEDILIAGNIHAGDHGLELEPRDEHLVCFLGGLMALGGKLFGREKDIDAAKRLTDGCIWAYKVFPSGIMPEVLYVAPCKLNDDCKWNEQVWKQEVLQRVRKEDPNTTEGEADIDTIIERARLPKGVTSVTDPRYYLRPEAIESVFVLYRVTGREDLLETAWNMFTAIDKATSTTLANSAIRDVTITGKAETIDLMESFWMGETLKYFYLIFSDPGLISLDEFVFNTEAHPFRRRVVSATT
jgi:mannosyl-oligosaccharide alpha-1,2-mannosidase